MILLPLASVVSDEKSPVNLIEPPFYVMTYFLFRESLWIWVWTVWLGYAWCASIWVFLLGVHWASWIFIKFVSTNISSNILPAPFSPLPLVPPWCTVTQVTLILFIFVLLFGFLFLRLDNLIWHIFKFTDSFLCLFTSAVEPSNECFISVDFQL